MPAPYLPRTTGDLITAEDWNEAQRRARAEIAELRALVEVQAGRLAALEGAQTTRQRQRAQILVATMRSGDGTTNTSVANSYILGVSLNFGGWQILNAPSLTVTVSEPTTLLLSASFGLQNSYGNANYAQLIISDGKQSAPIRSVGLSTRERPDADTLAAWLKQHQDAGSNGWNPVGFPCYVSGGTSPTHLEEPLEVPAGVWSFRLGVASTNFSGYIYGLILRAVILPAGFSL